MKGDTKTIKWPANQAEGPHFTGRNGYMICGGVEVLPLMHKPSIMLSPLTSHYVVGRCDIEIPLSNLPELVAALGDLMRDNDIKPLTEIERFSKLFGVEFKPYEHHCYAFVATIHGVEVMIGDSEFVNKFPTFNGKLNVNVTLPNGEVSVLNPISVQELKVTTATWGSVNPRP